MAPTLYMFHGSPPVRAVLITAKAIDLELECLEIECNKGKQFDSEYLKINPQHTVPTLNDNGTLIWDSHAINAYLVDKYAKDDSLYPKDLHKRAVINQRLHFDNGVLFFLLRSIVAPFFRRQRNFIPVELINDVKEGYGFLEKFLDGQLWVTGDTVTIADFNLATTVSSLDVLVKLDPKIHGNIIAWLKRAQTLPCFADECKELNDFKQLIAPYIK